MDIFLALLVLSLIVVIHEYGHYFAARMCNVGILEFAVGFGKRVWSCEREGTIYSLRLIPLGGFVSMVGEQADQDFDCLSEGQKKLLVDKKSYFGTKKVWQRALIVAAGPVFNLLSTVLFSFFALYYFGFPFPSAHPRVGEVSQELPAAKAGFIRGDAILTIQGQPVSSWNDLMKMVRTSGGKELAFEVRRESADPVNKSSIVTLKVTPSKEETEVDKFLSGGEPAKDPVYRIGLSPAYDKIPISFYTALYLAPYTSLSACEMTIRSMTLLIKGVISPKNLSGPIGVIKGASDSVNKGMDAVLDFAIILSVGLAIFNLLPIPVLDGGHLLLMLIETLIRRPLKEAEMLIANRVGLVFVLGLMVFAIGNDVTRLIFG